MGEPVVVNGIPITMVLGDTSKASSFSLGCPHLNANGLPVVTMASLLGGLTFTATLMTVKTKAGTPLALLPLVGAVVTDSAGYTGTISPAQGAGAKYSIG